MSYKEAKHDDANMVMVIIMTRKTKCYCCSLIQSVTGHFNVYGRGAYGNS